MKTLIPWVLAVVLLGGAAYLFSENNKKNGQLTALRAELDTVESLRSENAELKNSLVPAEEIAKLRKDAGDVLKLRNEVRQLRDQQQQLSKQLQAAQTSAQRQQEQVQKLQAESKQAQAGVQQTTDATAVAACINNLRQIDAAIQQWALENGKPANSPVTVQNVTPFLKDGFPKCPSGGNYSLATVEHLPMCSSPGHVLPQ